MLVEPRACQHKETRVATRCEVRQAIIVQSQIVGAEDLGPSPLLRCYMCTSFPSQKESKGRSTSTTKRCPRMSLGLAFRVAFGATGTAHDLR